MPECLAVLDEVFENCSWIRRSEIETTSHITVSTPDIVSLVWGMEKKFLGTEIWPK